MTCCAISWLISISVSTNKEKLDNDLERLVELLLDSFQLFRWLPDGRDHFFYGCPQEFHINAIQAQRIHSVQDFIYSHFTENITLGSLTKHEYLSTYYLSHFIRQATGLSFQQWLSVVRCEFAEKLLVSTDRTVSEIALEVGFASTKYLISHFKKWYGYTPSKYREFTAPMRSHLPHKYFSCDRMKAENLLNGYRFESTLSGRNVQNGIPLSRSLEKDQLPQKSDAAKFQYYMNLFMLSGEIYQSMADTDVLHRLAPELCVSYEAFLSEVMRLLKIAPQKEI